MGFSSVPLGSGQAISSRYPKAADEVPESTPFPDKPLINVKFTLLPLAEPYS